MPCSPANNLNDNYPLGGGEHMVSCLMRTFYEFGIAFGVEIKLCIFSLHAILSAQCTARAKCNTIKVKLCFVRTFYFGSLRMSVRLHDYLLNICANRYLDWGRTLSVECWVWLLGDGIVRPSSALHIQFPLVIPSGRLRGQAPSRTQLLSAARICGRLINPDGGRHPGRKLVACLRCAPFAVDQLNFANCVQTPAAGWIYQLHRLLRELLLAFERRHNRRWEVIKFIFIVLRSGQNFAPCFEQRRRKLIYPC